MVTLKRIMCLFLLWGVSTFGNDTFELSSSISKSKIFQNEILTLTLTVQGADNDLYKQINRPDMSRTFSIISTSQSSSFSYINGVANRTRQYRYKLRPIKPGIFIIDPFYVTYKGKKYSTKPLRIVVRKGNASRPTQQAPQQPTIRRIQPPRQQSKSIFIETKISTNNIFLGESIEYSVKFYRRVSLWSSISIEQEDLQGVWQNAYPVAPERVVRKNGQRYYELELVKKKIRPLSPGILQIPPLITRFVVDPFSGEYQLQSDSVTLNVNELPSPIPPSFTGAIGQYQMTVSTPTINEESNALQIQVEIQGTGNLEAIQPPVIKDTPEYRVLSAPRSDTVQRNVQLFDYVIIPKVTGEVYISPIEFSYFSKDTMAFVLLQSETITINATLDTISPSQSTFSAQEDIQFLRKNNMFFRIKAVLNHPNFNAIMGGVNGLFILFFLSRIVKKQQWFSNPSQKKTKKKILRYIHSLSDETSLNDMEKVLVDVLSYVTSYDHHGINPKEIEQSLIKADVSDPIVKGTMQWIKNTQLQQYSKTKDQSSHSNSESLKRILNHIVLEKEKK